MSFQVRIVLGIGLFFLMVLPAHGFDKERKGFVLDLGAGFGIATYKQSLSDYMYEIEGERESDFAIYTNFEIGYAPSNQLIILYTSSVPWFKMTNIYDEDVTVISGVAGPTVTYFLNPEAPSFFFGGGFGLAVWDLPFEEGSEMWTDLGLIGKLGYEFATNVCVTFHILYGTPDKTEMGVTGETKAFNVGATINWLAY